MIDAYDYRRFDLPAGEVVPSRDAIRRLLQPIGDEAWEITYVGAARDDDTGSGWFVIVNNARLHRWVDARRLPYGTLAPSSWEYIGFNIAEMPEPSWSNHIASRGWQRIEGPWYSYIRDYWYVFKRPNEWRGTDDGDILQALSSLGFDTTPGRTYLPNRPYDREWRKPLRQIVAEILDVKWQLSAEAGCDIGTQRAVESWQSDQ